MYELVVNGRVLGRPFDNYQDANRWYERSLVLVSQIFSIELWKDNCIVQHQYN